MRPIYTHLIDDEVQSVDESFCTALQLDQLGGIMRYELKNGSGPLCI